MGTFHYGGQAVMEGVMMRGRREMAVAVRAPDGGIRYYAEPLTSWIYRSRVMKWPFLRGIVLLWDALLLGTRALVFSANVGLQEEETAAAVTVAPDVMPAILPNPEKKRGKNDKPDEPTELSGPALWITVTFSLLFGVGLFFVLPLLAIHFADRYISSSFVSNIVEGGIRLGILVLYLGLIGLIPDVKRVFRYHGAEHKTIHAYERGLPLDAEHIRPMPIEHPRCGTGFLLVVVLFSILVFALLGRPPFFWRIVSRIVLVPVIAGVAYEFLRLGARFYHRRWMRILLAPSMALQKLTTRAPDDTMLDVAAVALRRVLAADDVIAPGLIADGALAADQKGQPLRPATALAAMTTSSGADG
ncbi:MAG: DUF1385 domain-containing protein [Thermomicrobia bacterium]|nr:DUF1385 domain-containing protein [Thermomicrobia bacterium]